MLEALAKSFSFKKLPESEAEFAGEIPLEQLLPYRQRALAHIAEHLELPGFRPGKVPHDIALGKVGEVAVLEEALELFVKDFYPVLIAAHKVDAVGRPDIRITKLTPGTPAGLAVGICIYPEVKYPENWKTLHEKIPLEPYNGELPKSDPPPSAEDEQKAREYMARSARRAKIVDLLMEKTEVAVPRVFVEGEQDKILSQMRDDVKRFGLSFDEYLQKINKTEEAMRSELRESARRRAKLQITLNKIAEEEKIEPDKDAAEAEIKHALEHFKDANQTLLRIHIETALRNEKVLKLLEGE